MTFLRPWLLLLILIPFVFNKALANMQQKSAWKNIIDAKLLPYLLVNGNKASLGRAWSRLVTILWIIFSVAVAGPALKSAPLPASEDLENTVIVLDLGSTMTPDMLNIAHTKLYDLVNALTGNRIGLVLYADKGYTAAPLTGDKAMIKNLIPSLNASVLPNAHNDPKVGFAQADQLIAQAGGTGRIIYITAGGVNVQGVYSSHPVGVLSLGKDEDVSPALKKLGVLESRTLDDSDIHRLLSATHQNAVPKFDATDLVDYALDFGGILCLVLLPFLAWTFRKGVLFCWLLLICNMASASFFVRPDQETFAAEQQAVKAYRAENYEQALAGFSHSPYNQGNTLAHMGKIPEAIQSYALALQLDPNDADAKFNKEYLEQQLQQQQQNQDKQQQENNQDQEQQNQTDANQEQENESGQDNSADSQTNEQQQPSSVEPQNESQEESSANETEESEQMQPEPLDTAEEESPFNQQEQQILNRLNKDPSQVLRYRIYKQHMQRR